MKFTDFCYHSNKGGSIENFNDSIGFANPKTPTLMQNSGIYLKCELSYCDFVWKFPNFRYHGNRGWSDTYFTYTVKSADPENPLFGARILIISYVQAEL